MEDQIKQICKEVENMLLIKNKSYGNSCYNPVRIFSKADPIEQINVRIDDKLSRIMNNKTFEGDNDEMDLIGYLILKQAAKAKIRLRESKKFFDSNSTTTTKEV